MVAPSIARRAWRPALEGKRIQPTNLPGDVLRMSNSPVTPPPSSAPGAPSRAANDLGTSPTPTQWADIVVQLGNEVADPLAVALSYIQNLTDTGKIDRRGLLQLRRAIESARSAGMLGQQLGQLAAKRAAPSSGRQNLTQMLRQLLNQRSRDTQARGIQIRQVLEPVEVWADGVLLFSLLTSLIDWALNSTDSSIELRLHLTRWPLKARLACRFVHADVHSIARDPSDRSAAPDSLSWRLVEQSAMTLGVLPLRERAEDITELILEFPNVVADEGLRPPGAPGMDAESDPAYTVPWTMPAPPPPPTPPPALHVAPSQRAQALAGYHVLLLTADRALRDEALHAMLYLGVVVDVVTSVGEAEEFCQDGLPHAFMFDANGRNPALGDLIAELLRQAPAMAVVELLTGDAPTRLSTATPDGLARIGRANLGDSLPGLLMFELSRHR